MSVMDTSILIFQAIIIDRLREDTNEFYPLLLTDHQGGADQTQAHLARPKVNLWRALGVSAWPGTPLQRSMSIHLSDELRR